MNSLEQVLRKLELTEYNGLFYFSKKQVWEDKFPYWIKRALEIIQPDAFYCYGNDNSSNSPFILFFNNPSWRVFGAGFTSV